MDIDRLDECRACTRPGNEICKPKEPRMSIAHVFVAATAILAIALGVALWI